LVLRAAYLITAYNDPRLLDLLVATLEPHRRDVFIHLDAKSDLDAFRLPHIDRAVLVPSRYSVYWATRSFTDAIMHTLQTAVNAGNHDYFVLMSGSDYPVRPVPEFEEFLLQADGRSFQTFKPVQSVFEGRKRLHSHYVIKRRSSLNVTLQKFLYLQSLLGAFGGRRPPPVFQEYYIGTPWFTVHRNVAEWMLECWKNPEIQEYFSTVYCAEEILIPSMIANSPWAELNVQMPVRFVEWQGTAHPKTLRTADLPNIRGSRRFFARKMDSETSFHLLETIGREMHGLDVRDHLPTPDAAKESQPPSPREVEKSGVALGA